MKVAHLCEVEVRARVCGEMEVVQQLRVSTLQQLVEDVEVSLSRSLVHHSRLLQQVIVDMTTNWSSLNTRRHIQHMMMAYDDDRPKVKLYTVT